MAAAHTPSGEQRPNGQQRSSEPPLSGSIVGEAADMAKPQPVSDSGAVADSDQVKAPSSAAASDAPTARVWYYVDPQVCASVLPMTSMFWYHRLQDAACRAA